MATHLSESSVNSLLRLINHADASGSYAEKVNLLKKSGILVGGNEYSSVVNKELGYKLGANTARETVTDFGGEYDDSIRITLGGVLDIVNVVLGKTAATAGQEMVNEITDILKGIQKNTVLEYHPREIAANRELISLVMWGATALDAPLSEKWYVYLAARILNVGISNELSCILRAADDHAVPYEEKAKIQKLLLEYTNVGFKPENIAYSTSNKLKTFFGDGLYNFTYITYPTKTLVNGISGTGICQIFSYYDIYTNQVVKKELNQSTTPLFSLKLQSFDIMTKYITMATNGSSSVGNFRFISDTICNVMYYGYSSLFGKFYTCKTVIQKTPLGFAIKSSIVNSDHSTTLYYVALYTRVSLPLEKIAEKISLLATDSERKIKVARAIDIVVKEVRLLEKPGLEVFFENQMEEIFGGRETISPEDFMGEMGKMLGVPERIN